MRRNIPLIITFITGMVLILGYFVTRGPLHTLYESFSDYFAIITVFAFILGGGNLIKVHLRRIANRAKDWRYSMVTMVGFTVTLIVGMFKIGAPGGWGAAVVEPESWLQFIFDGIFTPLAATMFALLAFFVASASYRAFRARTKEATILLVAACIILLGRTPIGGWLTGWLPPELSFLDLPNLANWIMAWPNTAGQRAIMIGIALGVVATSLRIIFGIERNYLGRDE